jgi:hypothetical protein
MSAPAHLRVPEVVVLPVIKAMNGNCPGTAFEPPIMPSFFETLPFSLASANEINIH